jgi:tRNA (cytidine/uridine-2'-O-)-methyltransferase
MTTRPRTQLPFNRPDPPLQIALVEPDIPQNTGSIARLCAATGTVLNLVEPLGFRITDKAVKRAGLDYWDAVELRRFPGLDLFLQQFSGVRKIYFSTSGTVSYTDVQYRPGDCLVFGSESRGLPLDLLKTTSDPVCNIPILLDHVRSLNLANAASIALYEALRQCGQSE